MEEICARLQVEGERSDKLQALQYLEERAREVKESQLQEILNIFNKCYLHLLKCYRDRFEAIRHQAVQTVNIFMERLPPNDYHFLNIVSTLAQIMGQQETLEKSEEIRLIFVQQLLGLQQRFIAGGHETTLHECYADIVRILSKALQDDYAAVQREACSCIMSLTSAADPTAFQLFAGVLAKSLYKMLNHKHSQSRVAAINALAQVALYVSAKEDALSNLIMEVSPLLMDSMPLVRRACGEMGALLLLKLPDRYSFFERLIPLILCCLKDDSPEVRAFIQPLWLKCGEQYYEENEMELSKQDIADQPVKNYPVGVQRPSIGCRGLVQRALRLLKLIMRESYDWKENVRLHSMKLLYQFVLHAEAAMTALFFEIYADMARACRDSEFTIREEAYRVADLMGRLLTYVDWREHGFEGLQKTAKEGFLKCFYYMYTPALNVSQQDNLRLSEILVEPDFSQSLKSEIQLYALKMVATILRKCKKASKDMKRNDDDADDGKDNLLLEILRNCYIVSVKVLAITLEPDEGNFHRKELRSIGEKNLEEIAMMRMVTLDSLHDEYLHFALVYVDNLDAPLDALSEPILLLNGLLQRFKLRANCLRQLQEKISVVFKYCMDEARVKVFTSISMAMLDWNTTIRHKSLDESCALLEGFLECVVKPYLSWKAGAHAEAMRSLAAATLCSLSQGAVSEAPFLLPAYASFIPNLLEDHCFQTRYYIVKCLKNFGEIPMEQMRPLAYALLQRMDDPSGGIRILATSAIPYLRPKFGNDNKKQKDKDKAEQEANENQDEDENTRQDRKVWENFLKYCMDLLYLHYDGPDTRLQQAIKETITQLYEKYPEICKSGYHQSLITTHDSISLKELGESLPFLVSDNNQVSTS